MNRRRVLILAHFFPPLAGGGVHRVLSFVEHLPQHGWDCTVVCAGEQDYWVRDESLLARVPAATEVLRASGGSALATWLRLRRGAEQGKRRGGTFAGLRALSDFWLVPDPYIGWAKRAERVALARLRAGGIDAVMSSSPPDSAHLAAAACVAKVPTPWVADFRDPWVGLHWRTPPTAWHARRQAALEKRVLEGADLVLTASRTHLEALGTRSGAHAKRAELLPNGYRESAPEAAHAATPDTTETTPMFHIAFTGTLALMEDLGTLLEALHEWFARSPEARRRVRVDLAGPYDVDHEDRALALGLSGIVRFHGALAHADARALQRRADVLVLWRPRGEGFAAMVPGKTYEYLDAGRPIVALLPEHDEAGDLVSRAGGTVISPGARDRLAHELETRYMAWKTRGRAPDARAPWLTEYARPALAARLAGMLDGLIGGAA